MDHPPYRDIPAPTVFSLFGPLVGEPASNQFAVDVDVKQAVTWLQTLDTDFLHIKIQALVPWWYKYLTVIAAYMEV